MAENNLQNIIIYNTIDGKASVALYAKDGNIWMNQNQLAELFTTSKQNIGQNISNILKDGELEQNSVIKNYFTTANDDKEYNVTFYSLDMILAVGFRVIPTKHQNELYNSFLFHLYFFKKQNRNYCYACIF